MRGEGGGLTWADLMSKEEGYVSLCADAENASEEELTSFKAELPMLLKTAAATVSSRLSRVVDESGTPISKVNLRPRPNVSEGAGGVGEGGEGGGCADGGGSMDNGGGNGGNGGSSGSEGGGGKGDGEGDGKGDGTKSKVPVLFSSIRV